MKKKTIGIIFGSGLLLAAILMSGCCPARSKPAPAPAPMQKPAPAPVMSPCKDPAVPSGMVDAVLYYPTGDCRTSAILLQKVAPAEVSLGQDYDYHIHVTNLTDMHLKEVMVKDTVPDGFDYKMADPKPVDVTAKEIHWMIDDLGPKEKKTIKIAGRAKQTGLLTDCATVTFVPWTCLAVKVVEPKLKLMKSGPDEVLLCDSIPLKYTVSNQGTGIAKNVKIMDRFPSGMTSQQGGTPQVSFDVGTLNPGQSRDFSQVVKVSKSGVYENKATATADGGLESMAAHTVKVVKPELVLTKTGPELRYIGRNAEYEITITNKGDGPARDTVLVDHLDAGLTFVSATQGGQAAGGRITWQLGTMAPGASKTVSITAKASTIGSFSNRVQATAYCAEASAQTTTKVQGIAAILIEVIDLEDPIEVGANETYVIVVTNQGSAMDTNIRIKCTLPEEMQYVSSSGPSTGSASGNMVEFQPLGNLDPKAKATYRVVAKGMKAGDLRFRVEMRSDQMTSSVMETESTKVY